MSFIQNLVIPNMNEYFTNQRRKHHVINNNVNTITPITINQNNSDPKELKDVFVKPNVCRCFTYPDLLKCQCSTESDPSNFLNADYIKTELKIIENTLLTNTTTDQNNNFLKCNCSINKKKCKCFYNNIPIKTYYEQPNTLT